MGGVGVIFVVAAVAGTGSMTQAEINRMRWRSVLLSLGILLMFFSLIGWLILKGCANTMVTTMPPMAQVPAV